MSTLALRVDRAAGGPGGRPALLRGPLPTWAALFANVLAFSSLPTAVPISGSVGQLVTQGALIVAFLLALLANPGGVVRPSLFLVLLTMLGTVALMVSIHNEFVLGSTFRACRLIGFTVVLWLLTPWWGRRDLVLLRSHLTCLRIVLLSVLVGAVLAPGAAFSYQGRLSGALWPIPPTQVAHYAAVLLGCTVVLWFGGAVRGRTALWTLIGAGAALVGTHTRTALIAMALGLAVAGASMFIGHARVRRTSALLGVLGVAAATLFAPLILDWLWRGQTLQEAAELTGRTKVWSAIFGLQRPWLEELFGSGLSNKSFNGLPIDSNWLAVYLDQGWFGVFVDAALLLVLILLAMTHRRGIRRAVALFLVTYCLVASISETGLGDASPYLLNLVVAASLLAAPAGKGRT
ncbi:MAG: O-antigen ligase domain-containing protein [Jiangellaceae bacterium]